MNDANNGRPYGLAPFKENWRDGARKPAGNSYSLDGVSLLTNSYARRLIWDTQNSQPAVRGVELSDGRGVYARKEVIVSCGTFRTPKFLMLSGIGPEEQLDRRGIPSSGWSKLP